MASTRITSHAEAAAFLAGGRDPFIRKVRGIGHTSVRLRPGNIITIRVHDTSVVTYHPGGSVTLNSGGWYTPLTASRINEFTPPGLRQFSINGRWYLLTAVGIDGYWTGPRVPFEDGMTYVPDENGRYQPVRPPDLAKIAREDAWNAHVRALLTEAAAAWRHSDNAIAGDACAMCVAIDRAVLDPAPELAAEHYLRHLADIIGGGGIPISLVSAACRRFGYSADRPLIADFRLVRKYLAERLYVGAVSTKGGRRPGDARQVPFGWTWKESA